MVLFSISYERDPTHPLHDTNTFAGTMALKIRKWKSITYYVYEVILLVKNGGYDGTQFSQRELVIDWLFLVYPHVYISYNTTALMFTPFIEKTGELLMQSVA